MSKEHDNNNEELSYENRQNGLDFICTIVKSVKKMHGNKSMR
jgi:hypothetical protein